MSYRNINSATRTVAGLLSSHFESDPDLGGFFNAVLGGTMSVSPRTPEEMANAEQNGLSVWLYRIARDPELLNLPPRRVGFDRFERQPLPLRLHYLMTPVVNTDLTVGNDPGME